MQSSVSILTLPPCGQRYQPSVLLTVEVYKCFCCAGFSWLSLWHGLDDKSSASGPWDLLLNTWWLGRLRVESPRHSMCVCTISLRMLVLAETPVWCAAVCSVSVQVHGSRRVISCLHQRTHVPPGLEIMDAQSQGVHAVCVRRPCRGAGEEKRHRVQLTNISRYWGGVDPVCGCNVVCCPPQQPAPHPSTVLYVLYCSCSFS